MVSIKDVISSSLKILFFPVLFLISFNIDVLILLQIISVFSGIFIVLLIKKIL